MHMHIYTYAYAYIYTHMHIPAEGFYSIITYNGQRWYVRARVDLFSNNGHIIRHDINISCLYVCMYVCMFVCLLQYICMHVCLHMYMHWMYVRVLICSATMVTLFGMT